LATSAQGGVTRQGVTRQGVLLVVVLPDRALYLPTFSRLLIVNDLLLLQTIHKHECNALLPAEEEEEEQEPCCRQRRRRRRRRCSGGGGEERQGLDNGKTTNTVTNTTERERERERERETFN